MYECDGVCLRRHPVAVGGGVLHHPGLYLVFHDVAVGVPESFREEQVGADALFLVRVEQPVGHGVDGVGVVVLVGKPFGYLVQIGLGEHVLIVHGRLLVVHDVGQYQGQCHGIARHGLLDDVEIGGVDVVGAAAQEAVVDLGQLVAAVALRHQPVYPCAYVASLRIAHVEHHVVVFVAFLLQNLPPSEEAVDVYLAQHAPLQVGLGSVHRLAKTDAVRLDDEILGALQGTLQLGELVYVCRAVGVCR